MPLGLLALAYNYTPSTIEGEHWMPRLNRKTRDTDQDACLPAVSRTVKLKSKK